MSATEYYNHTTYPANGAQGSSSAMRTELENIETGFGKLPDLSGNGGKVVAVNSGATALEAITTTGTGSGVRATSPTLVTPLLGTPTSGTLTNCTGLPIVDGTTGTLSVARGGTGATTLTGIVVGTGTSALAPAVSGTDIKTVNGNSLLGAGDIAVATGITTIASGSLPAAAVLDITNIPATYAYLVLQITGASCDTTTRFLRVQVSTDNGSSFDATAGNYKAVLILATAVSNPSAPSLVYYQAQAAGDTVNATVEIAGYQAGPYTRYRSRLAETGVSELSGTYIGSTSAIDALRILWDNTGNFDAGTYALYGVS